MKLAILLAHLFFAAVSFGQQISSGAASSAGKCSPPVTGNNNVVTVHCENLQSSKEMAKLLQMVHDSGASTQEVLAKLDTILEEMRTSGRLARTIQSLRVIISFSVPGYWPDLDETFSTIELEDGPGRRWQRLDCGSKPMPLMLAEHRIFPSGKPNEPGVFHTHELIFDLNGADNVVGKDISSVAACNHIVLSVFTIISGRYKMPPDDPDQIREMHARIQINGKALQFPDTEFTFLRRIKVADPNQFVIWEFRGDISKAYFSP